MPVVIGVRFKAAGKIYYFDPGELDIVLNDHVIVETARGIEYGLVVIAPRQVSDDDVEQTIQSRLLSSGKTDGLTKDGAAEERLGKY